MFNHSYTSLRDFDGKRTVNRHSARYPKDKDEFKPTQQQSRAKQVQKQTLEGSMFQRRHSEPGEVIENAAADVKSPFLEDLRTALVSADIAPSKASDPRFRWFLEKYALSGERGPMDDRYHECLARIRRRVAGKKIWASLDVIVDPADGELIGNVVIGTLSPDGPGETFLLAAGTLRGGDGDGSGDDGDGGYGDACDAGHAAARLFDDAMGLLWPDGVRHGDVLLLLQSAAWSRRAERTADSLAAVYAKMVPVACPASALRAAAEQICAGYPALDALVANVARAFACGAASTPALYCRLRARAPGVRPPPAASGHWAVGWIEAARYLCEHYRAVRDVLLDETDPRPDPGPAALAQRLAREPTAEAGLAFVDANYGFLPAAVARIEARDARLSDTVAEVFRVADRLAEVAGDLGAAVHRRFAGALRDNHGLRALARIADAGRAGVTPRDLPEHLCANDLGYFKYAPVAAVDVLAAFPRYRAVLYGGDRDKCGVHKTLVVQCNDFAAGGPSASAV